ncbi:TIGR03089 family protein [Micromonospora cathayae]|uniref:TIGR03089 family protein n=1 Tax=Micromonospora cathayae TaxID=3028804 RepID=A0ABY7ZVD1_9ACTN|nr:TIGR03089 family protein [Micromonospora sp. HUAS 3]WDZ86935.1 TIGR03089 family protein [Micromonospora sp. HUAS 3]
MADDVARVFAAAIAPDPTRPLLTWYDDATGERTELSGATLANWVAKTANLLVDDVATGPGGTVGVLLPPHWQTAAVLLGCWSAGVTVAGAPGPVEALAGTPGPVDALFAAADRVGEADAWAAGERYALALAPFAAPLRELPAGWADYVIEVRGHGDHFSPYAGGGAELVPHAAGRARELGLAGGDRVLVDAARHPDPVDWLLAPLSVGASIVLCGNLDPARVESRLAAEKATRALT